ncbi:MAG: DTW domain-containing protein [Massilia sp.]|nr:DTW domain-containing protein [Massilia sp.]
MSLPSHPRRATCATCLRPQASCICQWIAPLVTNVAVLILQHPLEVSNAKGSARLLHLGLPGSVLLAGEAFDADVLSALLYEGGRTPLLLYPDRAAHATPVPPALPAPNTLRLVVLDGTWRKSRKMLSLNPLLQGLSRLALQGMPASHYRIRKAHAPDQLSTLEASAYALMRLDGGAAPYQTLLAGFDGFVAQQAGYAPPRS